MKAFFLRWKKRHIWLAATLALLGVYFLIRTNRPLINLLTEWVTGPVKDAIGAVCYLVSVPVYEIGYIALALWAVYYLTVTVVKLFRGKKGNDGRRFTAERCCSCVWR